MSTDDAGKHTDSHARPADEQVQQEPEIMTEEEPQEVDEKSALKAELDDCKDRLLRKAAEFDNFRRRTRQEKEDLQRYGAERVLRDVVAVYDDVERALENLDQEREDPFAQGVRMVAERFRGVMQQHGVSEVSGAGEPFDPTIHEALQQIEDAAQPSNTVAQVLQKGYKLHERLLRPALVVVTKGGPQRQAAENEAEGESSAS